MFLFLPTSLSEHEHIPHGCLSFVFCSDACATCASLSLALSLLFSLMLTLPIYIFSSSSCPHPPPLFPWLLNQCLKCMSKVSLAQHLSTATHCFLFQEICMCGCLCVFSLSPHTNTHPSICPISTCAEPQPPGKLNNESLPQPSVAFLTAFSSFNFFTPFLHLSLASPHLFPLCRVKHPIDNLTFFLALVNVSKLQFLNMFSGWWTVLLSLKH